MHNSVGNGYLKTSCSVNIVYVPLSIHAFKVPIKVSELFRTLLAYVCDNLLTNIMVEPLAASSKGMLT